MTCQSLQIFKYQETNSYLSAGVSMFYFFEQGEGLYHQIKGLFTNGIDLFGLSMFLLAASKQSLFVMLNRLNHSICLNSLNGLLF